MLTAVAVCPATVAIAVAPLPTKGKLLPPVELAIGTILIVGHGDDRYPVP